MSETILKRLRKPLFRVGNPRFREPDPQLVRVREGLCAHLGPVGRDQTPEILGQFQDFGAGPGARKHLNRTCALAATMICVFSRFCMCCNFAWASSISCRMLLSTSSLE